MLDKHDRSQVPHFKMRCIVCEQELKPAFEPDEDSCFQPIGTAFYSRGHYGSSVWDPCSWEDKLIEIFICDECMVKKKDLIVQQERKRYTHYTYSSFNPR